MFERTLIHLTALFVCLCICLPAFLSVCLYVCLSVCLSVCLPACLPACMFACLSVCLSLTRSLCLSLRLIQEQQLIQFKVVMLVSCSFPLLSRQSCEYSDKPAHHSNLSEPSLLVYRKYGSGRMLRTETKSV